ncbi:MAG: SDR family oxidoreductase [Pseudomonadota bacterium]
MTAPLVTYADLKGASVLITGGGSGIGAAITTGFVEQGAHVAFIDIAQEASRALCDQLEADHGNRPLFIKADLADANEVREAVASAAAAHGDINVLVNNAAWDDRHDLSDLDDAYWEKNTNINLRHPFLTVKAVIDAMVKRGSGAIINFTSTSYMLNIGDMPVYTASKAGIVGFTKGVAGRYGPRGIRVNAVAPGWVMTDRQKELWVTEDKLNAFMERQAIPVPLEPPQMVGPCLFLASAASSAITAQTIIADHGVL